MLNELSSIISTIGLLGPDLDTSWTDENIKPTWLTDTDAFREMTWGAPIGVERLLVLEWETIGTRLGYNAVQMRKEREKYQNLGDLYGCSWHRCILHRQVPHVKRIMLQDTNQCGKAQYCSSTFQVRLFRLISDTVLPAADCQRR